MPLKNLQNSTIIDIIITMKNKRVDKMEETTKLVKKEKLSKIQEGILYFILYSFLGWCLETFYAFTVHGYFVKRGFLYGPVCPIYGFGAILLIWNLKNVKGGNFIKFWISMIVFTVFEYIASFALEAIFNQRWWDYSNDFMNLQGRICLTFSIIWGFAGILFINHIHPFIKKKIDKIISQIPFIWQKIILFILVGILVADEIVSILNYL